MKITDRIYYLDGKHNFHDSCEKFFDYSYKSTSRYIVTGEFVESKKKVTYVKKNPQIATKYYLDILGKVFLSLLIVPLIIYGIGLLISRGTHRYTLFKEVKEAEDLTFFTKNLPVPPPLNLPPFTPTISPELAAALSPELPPVEPLNSQEKNLDPAIQQFLGSKEFSNEGEMDSDDFDIQNALKPGKYAIELFKKQKDAFSPKKLRQLEPHNHELISGLRMKRLQYACNLKGFTNESLSEVYIVPMLYASLEEFFNKYGEKFRDIFNENDLQLILKTFGETVFFTDIENRSEEIVQKVNANDKQIISFSTGWDRHNAYGIFIDDILMYCNRKEGAIENSGLYETGITMYTKPEDSEISEEFLKKLLNRYVLEEKEQIKEEDFIPKFHFKHLFTVYMQDKLGGSHGYANAKVLILDLMVAHFMIKENKNMRNSRDWDRAFEMVSPMIRDFYSFDQSSVLKDFLIDLQKVPLSQDTREMAHLLRNKQLSKGFLIRNPLPEDKEWISELAKLVVNL